MDRSLRKSNPDCYESDGTLKKDCVLKKTKGCEKRIQRLQECHRKVAATRRCEHGELINLLLSVAGDIRVEKNQWKAFQRGHFGKSLGKSGISGFIERLKSKAESAGLKVTEVKPYKSLNERWHSLGESSEWIQRDVMSALLLQCADLEEEKHIPTEVIKTLEGAKQLLRDAGYVILKPSSNGDSNPAFASEPKAVTPEKVRLEIFCGTSDSYL